MGKMKALWQAEQEKNGWTDTKTIEMNQVNHLKRNNDPWNLWDNDDGGDAMISDSDLGALMARWEDV
jgi:hypothetical protein